MSNGSGIQHGRHCVFELHMHRVFVTKYRRRVFDTHAFDALRGIFADVCYNAQATLAQMNGEDGNVRLLVEYRPTLAVYSLVNSLKDLCSYLLCEQCLDIRKLLPSPHYPSPT